MVNIAVVAFFIDFLGSSCLSQIGLLLQKLAHREQEKHVKRISVNKLQDSDLVGEEQFNENKAESAAEAKAYCSWRFILGMTFMIIGAIVHLCVLPFLDLTLIAGGACLGILAAMILAILVLGERFNWRYDLPGLAFISGGCITIVLNANKVE